MLELETIARPYAKAAFEFALAQSKLKEWESALTLLCQLITNERVEKILDAPDLTGGQKSKMLLDLCAKDLDDKQQNFVQLLAENKRLILLPTILDCFSEYKAQREKVVDVDLQTAFPLDDKAEKSLSKVLSKSFDRQVNLSATVDSTLLGGVLVRAGDTVIDASIRGRLAKLDMALHS